MVRNVFLSFVEEDLDLVNLFRGQAKNQNSDLEFSDFSVKESYDSINADYIKQQIRKKLDDVSVLVCLIGKTTHSSKWVSWEITASNVKEKGLVGVRLHNNSLDIIPNSLKSYGGIIVNWNIHDILNAIEKAAASTGH